MRWGVICEDVLTVTMIEPPAEPMTERIAEPAPEPVFCDVSLPVPMDQAFTYSLPLTLRHRVKSGCRVLVPFGPRKLTGLVLETHHRKPGMAVREVLRLIDPQPVIDHELMRLARWI